MQHLLIFVSDVDDQIVQNSDKVIQYIKQETDVEVIITDDAEIGDLATDVQTQHKQRNHIPAEVTTASQSISDHDTGSARIVLSHYSRFYILGLLIRNPKY